MSHKRGYEVTFDIVNYLEQKLSSSKSQIHYIFDDYNAPLKEVSSKFSIAKYIFKPFNWIYIEIVRPVFILKAGFSKLCDKIFMKMVVVGLILLVFPVYFFTKNLTSGLLFIISLAVYSFWVVIIFFSFDYRFSKQEKDFVEDVIGKLSPLGSKKVESIQKQISILKIKFNKSVKLLSSILALFWSIIFFGLTKVIKVNSLSDEESLLSIFFLLMFLLFLIFLSRSYSRVYNHIFEVIDISCNEVLAEEKNLENAVYVRGFRR